MAIFYANTALDAVLRRILGPTVAEQMDNPAVQEVCANYNLATKHAFLTPTTTGLSEAISRITGRTV